MQAFAYATYIRKNATHATVLSLSCQVECTSSSIQKQKNIYSGIIHIACKAYITSAVLTLVALLRITNLSIFLWKLFTYFFCQNEKMLTKMQLEIFSFVASTVFLRHFFQGNICLSSVKGLFNSKSECRIKRPLNALHILCENLPTSLKITT